jgi:hypothetical protein
MISMTWLGGVTITAGVICLVLATLMRTVWGGKYPPAILALTITGTAGILGTQVGGWVQYGYLWVATFLGGLIGRFTGVTIAGVVALVIAVIVGIHVWDHFRGGKNEINDWTIGLGALLPASTVTIPGIVGTILTYALGAVTWAVSLPITAGLGLLH